MAATASNEFRAQWTQPSDTFSVLLIVGGEVIQLALANLTGAVFTPIAFSFGWVAYAITAVLGAIGDNRLISCSPEISVKVFDLKTGYGRDNHSWLLGRFVKTYDTWMPAEVREIMDRHKKDSLETTGAAPHLPSWSHSRIGLCVAVYTWSGKAGRPSLDYIWWSGLLVTVVQLGMAAIPLATQGNWAIILAAVTGTVLAYASASLPHWGREKYQARRQKKDFAVTRGQGSQHVLIVMGAADSETNESLGLDLADLAGGRSPEMQSTRIWTIVLAVLWVVFLITCTGIVSDTWYLLVVGGLGMMHNLIVAGVPRRPDAMGLPITLARTGASGQQQNEPQIFAETKVMWTLMEFELKYAGFGKALLPEFFPGALREWEYRWWFGGEQDRRGVLNAEKRKHNAL